MLSGTQFPQLYRRELSFDGWAGLALRGGSVELTLGTALAEWCGQAVTLVPAVMGGGVVETGQSTPSKAGRARCQIFSVLHRNLEGSIQSEAKDGFPIVGKRAQ